MKALLVTSIFLLTSTILPAQGPATWSQSTAYTHPALVINGTTTYISLEDVPANTAITNTTYWATLDSLVPTDTPSGADSLTAPDASEVENLTVPDSSSSTTASGLSTASNEAFVMQQYFDFLGRDGDVDGIAYWTEQLNTSQQTRADCVNNFVFSAEFQERVAPVSRLYLAYFLRLPDTGGLTYWIDQKLNGMTLNEISDSFAGVQEFSDRYGSLDDSGFVNLVYNNVLSRNPDSEGLTYWNGQMNGGMSRGEVMTGF